VSSLDGYDTAHPTLTPHASRNRESRTDTIASLSFASYNAVGDVASLRPVWVNSKQHGFPTPAVGSWYTTSSLAATLRRRRAFSLDLAPFARRCTHHGDANRSRRSAEDERGCECRDRVCIRRRRQQSTKREGEGRKGPAETAGPARGYSEGDNTPGTYALPCTTSLLCALSFSGILTSATPQLPHTNDLTSLSLCHSALHRLTIPCIYSRFDIVWPDESTHTEPRSGVDALTYGLATLVMGDDCFPHQHRLRQQGNSPSALVRPAATPYPVQPRRFGNYYGQFTKKFSLGNGPQAWVQEYMITKEGGKMLGTLVALAIARMINLETFVWDMPTGVLRDVWLALSSLAHRSDGEDCRLERLWIRWHDNTIDSPMPPPAPPMILNNVGVPPPPGTTHPSGLGTVQSPAVAPQPYLPSNVSALDRVEHPTFSAIPALKSLSVLDIDELPYLDEMSILIARSQKKLRELRVGIAPHAQQRDWVTVWEGDGLQQVDYSVNTTAASTLGEKRLGGVLGILVGRVHNMRHSEDSQPLKAPAATSTERSVEATPTKATTSNILPSIASLSMQDREAEQDVDHFGHPMEESEMVEEQDPVDDDIAAEVEQVTAPLLANPVRTPLKPVADSTAQDASAGTKNSSEDPPEELLNGKLKLEVLELERVPLSVAVLRRAFDWSILSTLTLLHCSNHEQLWKVLRRQYTPRSSFPGSPSPSKAYKASYTLRSEYQLNLKRIHTNTVSPALISFLKETLAPNSLEVLFLQEGRSYPSTVTVDAIYRGPMRRHRASLKKLMIDSGEKGPDGHTNTSSRWRRWMLNREILTFITSGRMSSLRELAVSIDYKDWVSQHMFAREMMANIKTAPLPTAPSIHTAYPFTLHPLHRGSCTWQQH
jgi:hypothetical protein